MRGRQSVTALVIALAVVFCLVVAPLYAQETELQLIEATPLPVEVESGDVISWGIRLEGGRPGREYQERLDLPQGWEPVLKTGVFVFSSDGATRLLAIRVPLQAAAGDYDLTYALSREPGSTLAEVTRSVRVSARTALDISSGEIAATVIAGQSLQGLLILRNQGNTPLALNLVGTVHDPGYGVQLDPSELTLAGGDAAEVAFTLTTPNSETTARPITLTVAGFDRLNPATTPVDAVILSTRVLPVSNDGSGMDLLLPATFTVRAVGEGDDFALQAELRARGAITEDGNTTVDLLLRGPDTLDESSLGSDETYRFSYKTPDYTARIGEHRYGLTSLTSRLSERPGLAFDWHPKDSSLQWGAFHALGEGRFEDEATGVYLRHPLDDDFDLQFNAARIEGAHEGSGLDELFSLQAFGRPTDELKLDLEYALGQTEDSGDGWEGAYRGDVVYKTPDVELNFRTTHAAPDYPGGVNDLEYLRYGVVVPLGETWSLNAARTTHARNLDRDESRGAASREERWQAGARHNFGDFFRLDFGYESLSRTDVADPAAFETREEVGRVSLGQTKSDFSWDVETRFGTYEDRLTGDDQWGADYRANLSWQPDSTQRYHLFGGISSTDHGGLLGLGRDYFGAGGSWEFEPSWKLRVLYAAYDITGGHPGQTHGEIGADYLFADGAKLGLVLRVEDGIGRERTMPFMLSYSTPLDITVGTRTSVGIVEGRLVDLNDPAHPGIAGVTLILGDVAAVTDKNGVFRFPPVPPGIHHLDLDLNTLGLDQITEQPLPLSVAVIGGDTTTTPLGVVPAASLTGQLVIPLNAPVTERGEGTLYSVEQSRLEPEDLDNLYCELTDGTQVLRRVTTEGGKIRFERLRPGTWTLRVYSGGIPEGWELPKATFEVTLTSGEDGTLEIPLAPRRRVIQILPST